MKEAKVPQYCDHSSFELNKAACDHNSKAQHVKKRNNVYVFTDAYCL